MTNKVFFSPELVALRCPANEHSFSTLAWRLLMVFVFQHMRCVSRLTRCVSRDESGRHRLQAGQLCQVQEDGPHTRRAVEVEHKVGDKVEGV